MIPEEEYAFHRVGLALPFGFDGRRWNGRASPTLRFGEIILVV
jgi:hypothetical protein